MRPGGVLALAALALALAAGGCGSSTGDPEPLEADAFEADDLRETAKEVLVQGVPVYHTISPADDVDFVRFRVTEADLDPADDGGPTYYPTLLGVTGDVTVALWTDQGFTETLGPGAEKRFAEPGIYYLRVAAASSSQCRYAPWVPFARVGTTGGPDLAPSTVVVPAEVAAGATSVTVGVRVTNQGIVNATAFHVKFYVSADRVFGNADDVEVSPPGGAAVSDLVAGFYQDVTASCDFSLAAAHDGRPVYVYAVADALSEVNEGLLEGNNVSEGSTLLGVTADDAAAPVVVAVPASVAGRTLFPAGDTDEYELTISAGEVDHWFEIWTDSLRAGADTKIEVLDSGATVLSSDEDHGPESFASYVKRAFAAAGTYAIRVSDEKGAVGGYDLRVRSCGTLQPDQYEPNDSVRTWRMLRAGNPTPTTLSLTASDDADEDWFAYPVTADDYNNGRTHTIATSSASGCDTILGLYDSNGAKVVENDDATGVHSEITFPCGPSGTPAGLYYVRVTFKAGQGGKSYSLSAQW